MTMPEPETPFEIRTRRFVLGQPESRDVDAITETCSDPLFEEYMALPWPYERRHAEFFVDIVAPGGWIRGDEWTWAIRETTAGPLLGVVGVRLPSGMLGYWMVGAHRGRGIITEAAEAVIAELFHRRDIDTVRWECVVGNVASARVAQKLGFTFTGEKLGDVLRRDGTPPLSWTGVRRRDDAVTPARESWPTATR